MGLFDRFKKKETNISRDVEQKQNRLPYKIEYSVNKDGKLQIDFKDYNADFKQFYDTTRLVLEGQAFNVNNNIIQKALVSWYGSEDCVMYGRNGEEIGRRTQYEEIFLGVDINLLQRDSNYCYAVMKGLLNEKRVNKYLERGMQEYPENPCGNYVGEIVRNETGYGKLFRPDVGRVVHNSNFMQRRRREHSIKMEEIRQKSIEERKNQMDRLQKEIDDLSK